MSDFPYPRVFKQWSLAKPETLSLPRRREKAKERSGHVSDPEGSQVLTLD